MRSPGSRWIRDRQRILRDLVERLRGIRRFDPLACVARLARASLARAEPSPAWAFAYARRRRAWIIGRRP